MKRFKKKGFTLIELMIVLAIIAILAVVLVPKAAALKSTAKSSGVTTNVNSVRAFVETKATGDKYITADDMKTALTSKFTGDNAITNPFTKLKVVSEATDKVPNDVSSGNSIVVHGATGKVQETLNFTDAGSTPNDNSKGVVFVYVYSDGYAVFGVDGDGNVINYNVVK